MTEADEERVAIIAESLKISQEAAYLVWQGQKPNPWAGLEVRAKAKKLENKLKKKVIDNKMKASGE